MTGIEALQQYKGILASQPDCDAFYRAVWSWIESRDEFWNSDCIRVGVIGVTSSGKSTLINAILGRDILTSAIAPSSGQLVFCSYGKEPKAYIRFENGSVRTLEGATFCKTELEKYSDERANTNNRENVLSIELSTPEFGLEKDILLVDSPGLDAFGLEAHEKLTLESLVPTIDACIYVTTMKTNSDRKMQQILNTVARYNRPIIIVQNMLDAVRPSPSGDRSREQVAADHKDRVKRIVDGSSIVDKNYVRIIQMSAIQAKNQRIAESSGNMDGEAAEIYPQSNYELFCEAVNQILLQQRPRIERDRLIAVKGSAEDLLKVAEDRLAKPAEIVESTFPLLDLKNKLDQHKTDTKKRLDTIIEDYYKSAKQIRKHIGISDDADVPNAERTTKTPGLFSHLFIEYRQSTLRMNSIFGSKRKSLESLLKETDEAVERCGNQLTELVKDYNAFVSDCAKRLRISERELLHNESIRRYEETRLEKKIEKGTRRVKKTGLLNRFKRGVGTLFGTDWGYDWEEFERTVTDVEQTKININDRLLKAENEYGGWLSRWERNNYNNAMNIIGEQIKEEEAAYHHRKQVHIESRALADLVKALRLFISALDRNIPQVFTDISEENTKTVYTTSEIEVDRYCETVLKLSRLALQRQHREIFKAFIKQVGLIDYDAVIVDWDDRCRGDFLWQSGLAGMEVVHDPVGCITLPKSGRKCLFVLVNTIQFGAAQGQIDALRLNELLTAEDYVVWVIQDLHELLATGNMVEGLTKMTELDDLAHLPCKSTIYMVHENPLYNLAFLEYQLDPSVRFAPHRTIEELKREYKLYYLSEEQMNSLGDIFKKVHLA